MFLALRLAVAAALALAAAGCGRGAADAGPAATEQGAEPPSTTLAAPADTTAPESEPEAPTSGEGQGEGESAEETPAMERSAEPPSTTLAAPADTTVPESEPEAPTSGEGQGEGESVEETPATERGVEPPSTTLAAPADTTAPESEPEVPTSGEGQGEGESAEETPATDDGHDHGPGPDDPEWVDELPAPTDPDPEPVGAVLDWDDRKLRRVEDVRPDVCEIMSYLCSSDGWTWGPQQIAIGTRAVSPGVIGESRVPEGLSTRRTPCGQAHRFTVAGFAAEEVGAGGMRHVLVLTTHNLDATDTLFELAEADPIDPQVGCAEAPPCSSGEVPCLAPTPASSRDGHVWGVVLPEHAGTVRFDGAGNMTGATLLLFSPPPLH